MNRFTEAAWNVINDAIVDDGALLQDLKKILLKEYEPFLTTEQSFPVHVKALRAYFLEKLDRWYDWLPNTTIHLIGGELAQEAFKDVDWSYIACELQIQLLAACAEKR